MPLTFEELLKNIKKYITKRSELEIIKKAYLFAAEKHFGQKRLTGEEYIIHPLSVAYILSTVKADFETISAALLHDVIEDCDVTKEQVQDLFGENIAFLVDGVTKINKLSFGGDSEATIAYQKKILVGLTEDVRVIIIKLADRLHNMRTLWAIPENKQKEKAKETLDVLTPIADRLGINQMKSELEDLSLRYYKPDAYFQIVEKLNQSKTERDEMVGDLLYTVSKLLKEHGIKHEIIGRAKSVYSIYNKLHKGKSFDQIYDIFALRIFVNTEELCYQALGIIHSKFKPVPGRFKDYIAMPKTNMYQSLHTTVFSSTGVPFEIQIRTYEMDKIAEYGIASHWSYKEKGSVKANMQSDMEQKLQIFRSIMDLNKESEDDEVFVNSIKEDFKDTIYVFTPLGDVIELPNGSTPIDFAYRVHTNIGDKMVGAIVNGSIVPLDYKLKTNDIVKINTNKNSIGPSKEWINIAYTQSAKNKIKSFYNKIDKLEYVKKGEEIMEEGLRKRKIPFNDFFTDENINRILEEYKYQDIDDLYNNVGLGKLAVNSVINIVYSENETKEELILKKTLSKEVKLPTIKNDIIVEGIDDIKVNIASCCKPIPGDRIIGYITKGYGITIHRLVCPNVSDLHERTINVRWNEETTKKYPTSLLISSISNNILLDIISKTSNNDINVESINTINTSEGYLYNITILVKNKESLEKFIFDLKNIPDITSIDRMIK